MADAILSLIPTNDQYEMIYSSLPKSVLDNWHTDFYGSLIVRYDKCTDNENVLYKKVSVMLYNDHLYVWLCSLSTYQNIVLKSVSQYIPSEEFGYLKVYSVDADGKPYSIYVKIEETGDYGYTPCTFKLKPGTYHVKGIPGGWNEEFAEEVDVLANHTTELTFKLPRRYIKFYGVQFEWPTDADYAIAYKIWNPLGKSIERLIERAFEYQTKFLNYDLKYLGGSYSIDMDSKNGVIVFWFKKTKSEVTRAMIATETVAVLIVVAVLVGIIVRGWIEASRAKIEYEKSYRSYTDWLKEEDERLDEQLKQGLISEDTYKQLVEKKHSTSPPSPEIDWEKVAKYAAIAVGVGIGGALLLKGMSGKARGTVVNIYEKGKEYASKAISKGKEYVGKLRGG